MSDAYEYSSPWIRSGDMYGTVPTNVPHLPKESCSSATHPKSETLHSPRVLRRMFCGLRSRWTRWRSLSSSNASRVCLQMVPMHSCESGPIRLSRSPSEPPSMYSIAICMLPSRYRTPRYCTRWRTSCGFWARSRLISLKICLRRDGSEMQMSLIATACPSRCTARRTKPLAPRPMISSAWSCANTPVGSLSSGSESRSSPLALGGSAAGASAALAAVTPSRVISYPAITNLPDSLSLVGVAGDALEIGDGSALLRPLLLPWPTPMERASIVGRRSIGFAYVPRGRP
mmetsp:Transcript_39365/g.108442  ORF Transcript_39365/g.108442 Transcript_39365/m.108442 type:complete len:287 (-) Transcript_39365:30-890(-)